MSNNNFVLIGAAVYIAPRHMKAIKETGNNLVATLDPNDSVGIIDSYFPQADFFTEFERFDSQIEKLRRERNNLDYVSICSPNYLHDAHIHFALRHNADAICEKPLVLNPWNVDALAEIDKEARQRIWSSPSTFTSLGHHPEVILAGRRINDNMGGYIASEDIKMMNRNGNAIIGWRALVL